jgi:hypothetical protein
MKFSLTDHSFSSPSFLERGFEVFEGEGCGFEQGELFGNAI